MGSPLLKQSPLESKKFVAAMTWNVFWLGLIAYGISSKLSDSVLLAMIYISGSTQMIYIGGQAAVDAIVRKAASLFPLNKSDKD